MTKKKIPSLGIERDILKDAKNATRSKNEKRAVGRNEKGVKELADLIQKTGRQKSSPGDGDRIAAPLGKILKSKNWQKRPVRARGGGSRNEDIPLR